MSTTANPFLSASTEGFSVQTDYATLAAATAGPAVQALIDLVSAESAEADDVARAGLDGMLPATRDALYAHLVALKAAVNGHTAP